MKVKNIKLLTRNLLYVLSERKKKSKAISCSLYSQAFELWLYFNAPDFVPNSCMVTWFQLAPFWLIHSLWKECYIHITVHMLHYQNTIKRSISLFWKNMAIALYHKTHCIWGDSFQTHSPKWELHYFWQGSQRWSP